MSMFEQASRQKLRFDTSAGRLAVDDLWDLPLKSTRGTDLNEIELALRVQVQTESVASYVDDDPKPDATVQLRFDIIRHIIDVKKAERRDALEARDKAERKQKIMAILAKKQDEKLESASEDELRGLLASL